MKALIVQCHRKSLIAPQKRFLANIGVESEIMTIGTCSPSELKKKAHSAAAGGYQRVMITNGSDRKDIDFVHELKRIKPNQRMLYCEKGWLPYSKYMFFDALGFGNHTDLFSWGPERFERCRDVEFLHDKALVIDEMKRGSAVPYNQFVFAPLQVDNDSKMWIGSPHFRMVKDFVEYLISVVPKDVPILFRNHPHNKKPARIPKKDNVVDVTRAPFKKIDLAKKSILVAGINTTFLLESLLLNCRVVSYGLDVFSNKGIVCDGYGKGWDEISKFSYDHQVAKNFLFELMKRQAYRENMPDIVAQHRRCHWAKAF